MASGKLGAAALSANTDTTVYTVPSSTVATVNVNMCNRGTVATTVRLAVAATGSPGNSEFIEYEAILPPNGVLERTGIVCSAAERVVARAASADVSVRVHGFEEAA